jgi:hypothetical protein
MSLKTGGEVGEERLTQLSANWNLLYQPFDWNKQEMSKKRDVWTVRKTFMVSSRGFSLPI